MSVDIGKNSYEYVRRAAALLKPVEWQMKNVPIDDSEEFPMINMENPLGSVTEEDLFIIYIQVFNIITSF